MKQYQVILTTKPAVRLVAGLGNIELKFEEQQGFKKVVISKIEENLGGSIVQTGLRMKVSLGAQNIDEAVHEAKALVDGILSFVTLVSGIGTHIPIAEIAYEVTADSLERDFTQAFHDPFVKQLSRRVLSHETLTELMDLFFKLQPEYEDRIQRAVRWYRLGVMTEDIFDQFNCSWIGLESINPLLQRKLSVKDDPATCPKCKHEWVAMPTVSGIREFIQMKIPGGMQLYKKMRSLRIDIMHSVKRLQEIRDLAIEVAPKASEILFRALCYLIDDKFWNIREYKPILKQIPLRIELRGKLIGGDSNSLGPNGEDPHFDPKEIVVRSIQDENGRLTFSVESSFIARLGQSVQLSRREVRLYGDLETTGKITSTS